MIKISIFKTLLNCCFLVIFSLSSVWAQCQLKKEIQSIHDAATLMNNVLIWSQQKKLNVYCHFEIGKKYFVLFLKNQRFDVLNHALEYINFSSKNMSKQDEQFKKCNMLNAYLGYLYQFNPDFLNTGFDPITFFDDKLSKECMDYQIISEKKILLKQAQLMQQYYHAMKQIIKNPTPEQFEIMFDILNNIEQTGLQKVPEMRTAYHTWQQYFVYLNQTDNAQSYHCRSLEMALNNLYQAQKKLPFLTDNRSACISYVNCQFDECQKTLPINISQLNMPDEYSNYLTTWRNNYDLALALCNNNAENPVPVVKQYVNQVKQHVKTNKKTIQTRY